MSAVTASNPKQKPAQIRRLLEIGDLHRAETLCQQAAKDALDDAALLFEMGRVHYFRKRHAKAAELFRWVLQTQPQDANARIMLWAAYRDSGNFEAMLELARDFESHPLNPNEVFMAYRSYLAVCDWQGAKRLEPKALDFAEQGKIKHDMLPALLIETCAMPDISAERVLKLHRLWGDEEARQKLAHRLGDRPVPSGAIQRLKIAYLSADFKLHPVGFFTNHIIPLHNRDRFEVYCYAHIPNADSLTEHVRQNADHFIDVTRMTDQEVAERIHADGIHILIDLGGLTTDSRISVLAYRPAPVQITYLGYPNTTGLPTVDFRITDHYADCDNGTRYVEELLYMPQSFICFGADPTLLASDRAPAQQRGHVTFGSFNNIRKLTPQAIEAWSRILDRVEGSMLALKAKGLDKSIVRDNLLAEFARHGIGAERIQFSPWTETYEEHILRYRDIDIALDTFPYNGTTTTCDALSLGIPVVTLVGKSHAQRVSYSILKNIGFEESIAYSLDEYVDKAVQLAQQPENLTILRKCLGTLFRYSILRQPMRFVPQLEELYRQAWETRTGTALDWPAADCPTAPEAAGDAEKAVPEWIFIVGMVRSGSTWAYNVVRKLLERAGIGNIIGHPGEAQDVDEVLDHPSGSAPRLIKFHTPTDKALELLKAGRAKAIYTQRDLRDVIVSLMQFEGVSFEQVLASPGLKSVLHNHDIWRATPNLARVEYQDIMTQPRSSIRDIASFLGLTIGEEDMDMIAEACGLEASRNRMVQIRESSGNHADLQVREIENGRRYDIDTLLHANHIASGKIGRYKECLDQGQMKMLDSLFGDWLLREGYERALPGSDPAPAAAPSTDADATVPAEKTGKPTAGTLDPRMTAATILHDELADTPIVIAEVGARIVCENAAGMAAEIFHSVAAARVLAFEADADACDRINAQNRHSAADIRAYPHALGHKSGRQTLHIARDSMCSSLYKPNERVLKQYAGLDEVHQKASCKIDVITLDQFMEKEGITHLDFIKIDVQGAELDVFKGATKAMPNLIGVCTEVEFVELYQGQPLFADVDALLRRHGLQLHHFVEVGVRPLRDTAFHSQPQLLWGDAVYFPSLQAIDRLPAKQLLKLSVMANLYDAPDLSQYALRRYDEICGSRLMVEFVEKLAQLVQGGKGDAGKDAPQVAAGQPAIPQPPIPNGCKAVRLPGKVTVLVPDNLNLMTPYVLSEQGDWFEDEIKFVRRLMRPAMRVLDIGANYGCYALTMAHLIGPEGRLWAFEPASSTANYLARSIEANGLKNIHLIRAALSNHTGDAELAIGANAELNAIVQGKTSSATETVPVFRLDDCLSEYGWQDIDFVKLDAEGEEMRIAEGGRTFFTQQSPLVMFELKHGDKVNEGLIQHFIDLGYRPYALVPGLSMLVPFDPEGSIDAYQLNLFCCRGDRAAALERDGLLCRELTDEVGPCPEGEHWQQLLDPLPYAQHLLPLWREQQANGRLLPGGEAYRQTLNTYALAHGNGTACERYHSLRAAFLQLVPVLDEYTNLPRLFTLARITAELGQRAAAVNVLNDIARHFERHQNFVPEEPFLAVSIQAEQSDPGGKLGNWCLAHVLAERERLQAFSSYFTGESSLPMLELIRQLGFEDADMLRRHELIQQRFSKRDTDHVAEMERLTA